MMVLLGVIKHLAVNGLNATMVQLVGHIQTVRS
jgi:hypothetical protein